MKISVNSFIYLHISSTYDEMRKGSLETTAKALERNAVTRSDFVSTTHVMRTCARRSATSESEEKGATEVLAAAMLH